MKNLSYVILFISILCWCSGCHNSTSYKKDVELCEKDSIYSKKNTIDKLLKVEEFPNVKDTIITCNNISELVSSGKILTHLEDSVFDLSLKDDTTITLIKTYKENMGYLCFFYLEYSDLTELIIKSYDNNGQSKYKITIQFKCYSDLVDSDGRIETVQTWSSTVLLDKTELEVLNISEIYDVNTEEGSSVLKEYSENTTLYSLKDGKLLKN